MKHSPVPLEKRVIDGVTHVCFRDIVHNLLIEQIDFRAFNEKIKEKATKPLSPKHRKRLLRQAKRMSRK